MKSVLFVGIGLALAWLIAVNRWFSDGGYGFISIPGGWTWRLSKPVMVAVVWLAGALVLMGGATVFGWCLVKTF